jgi:hypothetical protein
MISKSLYISLILTIVMLVNSTKGSCQVYNNGAMTVKPNENVYIQGDYINQSGGRINLSGTVHLYGNWMNYDNSSSIVSNSTNGLLRFTGNSQQTSGGTQSTRFTNVELNNANGLLLARDADIRQTFTFTAGKVFTNSNYLIISTTDNNAIIGHDVNKYIVGNLRRYVTGTSPYDLPVGTSAYYELANIKFNSMSGIQYINTNFVQTAAAPPLTYPSPQGVYVYPDVMNPVSNPLSLSMSKYSYIAQFLNYGYWVTAPDNVTAANFRMTLTERGHTNGGTIPGNHALIRRNDGSGLWNAQGIYTFGSQIGSGTNPVTVYMDQMTGFSHFIIGTTEQNYGPLGITLESFNANCNDGKVRLQWKTSNEYNNEYFTIEKSPDLVRWSEVLRVPGQLVSMGEITYDTVDPFPFNGISYYRLKQTDADGNETIFDKQWLRYTNCESSNVEWIVVHQDENNHLIIDFLSEQPEHYLIGIYDVIGRLIYQKEGISVAGQNTEECQLRSDLIKVAALRVQTGTKVYTGKYLIDTH